MKLFHHIAHGGSPRPLEDFISSSGKWFSAKGRKQAFWGALITGLCCHLYILTNMLPNHDWQHNFDVPQRWPSYGRWALEYACAPSSNAILPWLDGLLALLLIALSAVFVVDLLELDRPVFAALAGGCMAAFPAVASTFTYIYTADGYMIALLLAVLAAWCCLRWRKWFWGCIPAALMMGTSMGIYQSYASVALLLFCMFLVLGLLRNMTPLKELIGNVMRMALTSGLGFTFYYVMMRLALAESGQSLSLYQGIDCLNNDFHLADGGLMHQIHLLINARHYGLKFLTDELPFLGGGTWGAKLVWGMYLLLAVLFIALFIVKKQWKKWYAPLVQRGVLLIFPLGVNYVQVVSPEINYHLLMHYSAVMVFIAVLCFAQLLCDDENTLLLVRRLSNLLPPILCVCLLFHWGVISNVGYTNMQYKYERSYSNMVRLADRMEQCEGYYPGIPVWFNDTEWHGDHGTSVGDQTGMTGMVGVRQFDSLHYRNFMRYLIGLDLNLADYTKVEPILSMPEFIEMPVWPASGSVQVLNGVLVVKTAEIQN